MLFLFQFLSNLETCAQDSAVQSRMLKWWAEWHNIFCCIGHLQYTALLIAFVSFNISLHFDLIHIKDFDRTFVIISRLATQNDGYSTFSYTLTAHKFRSIWSVFCSYVLLWIQNRMRKSFFGLRSFRSSSTSLFWMNLLQTTLHPNENVLKTSCDYLIDWVRYLLKSNMV